MLFCQTKINCFLSEINRLMDYSTHNLYSSTLFYLLLSLMQMKISRPIGNVNDADLHISIIMILYDVQSNCVERVQTFVFNSFLFIFMFVYGLKMEKS